MAYEYKVIEDRKVLFATIQNIILRVEKDKLTLTDKQKQNARYCLAAYSFDYLEFMKEDYVNVAKYHVKFHQVKSEIIKEKILEAKKIISSNREGYDISESLLFQNERYAEAYEMLKPLYNQIRLAEKQMDKIDHICNSLK